MWVGLGGRRPELPRASSPCRGSGAAPRRCSGRIIQRSLLGERVRAFPGLDPEGEESLSHPSPGRPLQNPGVRWIVETISAAAEGRSYAPVHPCARTHRRVAAAAGGPQRPAGAADAAHRLGAAGGAGGGPARRAGRAAEVSAAADGESAAAPAVVPGLGPCDGRGVVGAAVVPALRGVGAARRRAGSLDDQPLPHAADGGGRGRAAVRGGGAATGRARAAGHAGHAAGRDVGGRAGAPPERGAPPARAAPGTWTRPGPGGAHRRASATSCTWAWTPTRN